MAHDVVEFSTQYFVVCVFWCLLFVIYYHTTATILVCNHVAYQKQFHKYPHDILLFVVGGLWFGLQRLITRQWFHFHLDLIGSRTQPSAWFSDNWKCWNHHWHHVTSASDTACFHCWIYSAMQLVLRREPLGWQEQFQFLPQTMCIYCRIDR